MGTHDAQGVYLYDETDPASPFSDLLNLSGESISAQLALLRAQLALLTPGAWTTITPSGGWKAYAAAPLPAWRVEGDQVHLRGGRLARTTSVLGTAAVTPYQLSTALPAAVRPPTTLSSVHPALVFQNSYAATAGQVYVTAAGALTFEVFSAGTMSPDSPQSAVHVPDLWWPKP